MPFPTEQKRAEKAIPVISHTFQFPRFGGVYPAGKAGAGIGPNGRKEEGK
jgi:hypothetical protein